MQKRGRRILSLVVFLTAAALFAMSASVAAQTAGEPQAQENQQKQSQEQDHTQTREQPQAEGRSTAPVRRAVPHVTGIVTRWNGNRIDLKTPEGKLQKVAVNQDTERLVEIKEGAEVTVEYRRKISGFVIAERVLPAAEGAPAARPGTGSAPAQSASALTGDVVSWNNAELLLRTDAGAVKFFLSPSTEYLVEPLHSGLRVTVEYREGSDRAKVATRVLAVQPRNEEPTKSESGSE